MDEETRAKIIEARRRALLANRKAAAEANGKSQENVCSTSDSQGADV